MTTIEKAVVDLRLEILNNGGLQWPFLISESLGLIRAKFIITKDEGVFACLSQRTTHGPYNSIFIPFLSEVREAKGYKGLSVVYMPTKINFSVEKDGIAFRIDEGNLAEILNSGVQINNKLQLME